MRDRGLPVLPERPRTRGDCVNGIRPCPWIACRYHLLFNVGSDGHIRANHPDGRDAAHDLVKLYRRALGARAAPDTAIDEVSESIARTLLRMTETCALDVADRGPLERAHIARLFGLTIWPLWRNERLAHDKIKMFLALEKGRKR